MTKEEREENLNRLCGEGVNKALLKRFWEHCPDTLEVRVSMFWVSSFIAWLEDEELQITPKEFKRIH